MQAAMDSQRASGKSAVQHESAASSLQHRWAKASGTEIPAGIFRADLRSTISSGLQGGSAVLPPRSAVALRDSARSGQDRAAASDISTGTVPNARRRAKGMLLPHSKQNTRAPLSLLTNEGSSSSHRDQPSNGSSAAVALGNGLLPTPAATQTSSSSKPPPTLGMGASLPRSASAADRGASSAAASRRAAAAAAQRERPKPPRPTSAASTLSALYSRYVSDPLPPDLAPSQVSTGGASAKASSPSHSEAGATSSNKGTRQRPSTARARLTSPGKLSYPHHVSRGVQGEPEVSAARSPPVLVADTDLLPTGSMPAQQRTRRRKRPASAQPVLSQLLPQQAEHPGTPPPAGAGQPSSSAASAQKAVRSLVLMRRTLNALAAHYTEVQETRASATQEATALRAQLKAAEQDRGGGATRGGRMAQLAAAVEQATRKVQATSVAVPDPVVDDTLSTMTEEYTRTARYVLRGLEDDAPHMVGPVRELLAVVPEFHSAAERRRSEAQHARKSQRKALLWRKASFANSMLGEEGGSSSGEEGGVHEIRPGQSFRLGCPGSPPSTPHRLTSPFHDSSPPSSPLPSSPGSASVSPGDDLGFLALDRRGASVEEPFVRTSSAATCQRRAAQRSGLPASPTIPEGNEAGGGLSLPAAGSSSQEGGPQVSSSTHTGSDGGRDLEDDITEDTDLLNSNHDGLLAKVTSDLRRRQLASTFAGSFGGSNSGAAHKIGSFSTVTMSPKRRADSSSVSFSPPQGEGTDSGSDEGGVFKGGRLHHAARRLISALRVSKAVRSNNDPRGAWGNADRPANSLPGRAEAALMAATASLGGGGVQRVEGGGIDADEDELADESHADRSLFSSAASALGPSGEELAPSLPLAALEGGGGYSPATRGNGFMAAARSSMLRPRLATEAIAAQVGEALPPGEGMRKGLAPDQGGGSSLATQDTEGPSTTSRPRASRPVNMSWGDAAAAARANAAAGGSPRQGLPSSSLRPWSAGHAPQNQAAASLQQQRPSTAQGLSSPSQRPSVSLGVADLGLGSSRGARSQSARRARAGSLREPAFRPSAAVFALTTGTAEHRRIIARDNTLHHAMTAEVGGIAAPLVRRLRQHVQTLEQESEVQTELASRAIADLRSRLGSYHEGKRSWAVRNGAPIARRMDELAGVLADMEGETKAQTSALGGVDRMLLKMKGLTDKWTVKAEAQAARRWRDTGAQTDLTAPLDTGLEAHFRAKMAAEFDAEIEELKARRKHAAALGGGLFRVGSHRSAASSRSAAASLSAPPRVAAVYHMYAAPPLLPPMAVLGIHAAHGPGTWLWHFLTRDTSAALHVAGVARSLIALGPLLDTAEGILRTKAVSDGTRDAEGAPRMDIWAHALTYFKQSFGAEGGSKGAKSASMGPRRTLAFLYTLHAYSKSPLAHLHPTLGFILGVFGLSSTPLFGCAMYSPLEKAGYDVSSSPKALGNGAVGPQVPGTGANAGSPRASSVMLNVSADTLAPRSVPARSYASRLMLAAYWSAKSIGATHAPHEHDAFSNTADRLDAQPSEGGLSRVLSQATQSIDGPQLDIQGALAPPLQDAKNTAVFLVEGQVSIHHRHLVDSLSPAPSFNKGSPSVASLADVAPLPPFGAPFVSLPQPKDLLRSETPVALTPCGAPINMDSLPLPEYFPALRAAFLSTCAGIAEKYKGVLQGRGISNRASTPSKRPPSAGSRGERGGGDGVPSGVFVPPPRSKTGARKSVAATSGEIHLDLTRLMSPYAVHTPAFANAVLHTPSSMTAMAADSSAGARAHVLGDAGGAPAQRNPRPRRASSPGFRAGGRPPAAWEEGAAVPLAQWAGDTEEEGGTVDGGGEEDEVLFRLEDDVSEGSPHSGGPDSGRDSAHGTDTDGLLAGDVMSAPGSPKQAPANRPPRCSLPRDALPQRPLSAGGGAGGDQQGGAWRGRPGMRVDTGAKPTGSRPTSAGVRPTKSLQDGFESIKKPPSLPLSPVFEARPSGGGSPTRRQGPLTDADVDDGAMGDVTGLSLQLSASAGLVPAVPGSAPHQPSTLVLDGRVNTADSAGDGQIAALRPQVWRPAGLGSESPAASSNVFQVAHDCVAVMTSAEAVQVGQAGQGGLAEARLAGADAALCRLQVAMGVRASTEHGDASVPSPDSNKQQRTLMSGMSERNMAHSEHIWVPLSPLLEALRPFLAGVGHLPAPHMSPFAGAARRGQDTAREDGQCSIAEHIQEELLAHCLLPALAGDPTTAWSDPFVVTPGGQGGGSLDAHAQSPSDSPRHSLSNSTSRSVSPRRGVPSGPAARLPAKLRLTVSQKRDLLAKEKFVNALAKLGIGSLRGTFQRIDVDGSGEISVGEMKRFIGETHIPLASSDVARLVRSMAGSSATSSSKVSFLQFTNAFREVHATGGMLVVEAHVAVRLLLGAHLQAVQMAEANWAAAFIAADWTAMYEQKGAPSGKSRGAQLAGGHLGALPLGRFLQMLASVASGADNQGLSKAAALPANMLPFPSAGSVLQADSFMAASESGTTPLRRGSTEEHLLHPAQTAEHAGISTAAAAQWRLPPGVLQEAVSEVTSFMGLDAAAVMGGGVLQPAVPSAAAHMPGAQEAADALKSGPMGHEGAPPGADVAAALHGAHPASTLPAAFLQYAVQLFALAASRSQARLQWAAQHGRPVATDGSTQLSTDTAVPRTAATSSQSPLVDFAPLTPGMSLHGKWVPPVAVLSLAVGARPSAMVWSGSQDSLVELGLAKPTPQQQGSTPVQRLIPTLHGCMATLFDILEVARRFNLTAPPCKWALGYTLLTSGAPRGSSARPGSGSDATPAASVATPRRSPSAQRPLSAVSSLTGSRRRAALAHAGGATAAWSPPLDTDEDAASEGFFATYMAALGQGQRASSAGSKRPQSAGTFMSAASHGAHSAAASMHRSTLPSVDVGRPLRPGSAILRPSTAGSGQSRQLDEFESAPSRTPERAALFRYHEAPPPALGTPPRAAMVDRSAQPAHAARATPSYAMQTSPMQPLAGRGVDAAGEGVLDVVARYTLASPAADGEQQRSGEYLTLDDIVPAKYGLSTVRVAPFNLQDNADGLHRPRQDASTAGGTLRQEGQDALGTMTMGSPGVRKGASPQREGASPRFVYSRQRPQSTPPRLSGRAMQTPPRSASAGRAALLVESPHEALYSPPHSPVRGRGGTPLSPSSSAAGGVLSVGPEGGPTQPVSPHRAQHQVTQRLHPAGSPPRGSSKVRGFSPHSPAGSHADSAVRAALAHVQRSQLQRVSLGTATDDTLSRVGRGSRQYVVPAPPDDPTAMRVGPMSRRPHRHASYVLPHNAGAVVRGDARQVLDGRGRSAGSTEVLPPVGEPRPTVMGAMMGAAVSGGRPQGRPSSGGSATAPSRAAHQLPAGHPRSGVDLTVSGPFSGGSGRAAGAAPGGQLRSGPLGGSMLHGSFS